MQTNIEISIIMKMLLGIKRKNCPLHYESMFLSSFFLIIPKNNLINDMHNVYFLFLI